MGVAWSRIAIGAHWPADVIAGAGFGMLAACLACWWEHHGRWAPRLAGPRAQRLVAAAEAALVAVFWVLSYLEGDAWWPLRIAIGLIGLASALRRWRASTRNNRGNDQATAGTARGDHAPETEHQPPTTA